LAFDEILILLTNDIWCFRQLPLVSRDSSHIAWIVLPFKIIDAGKSSVCLVDLALWGVFFSA
jgi:hypothetical protein